MMAVIASALLASALLMLVVLAVRTPVRRWVGPRLAYMLWALPAVRLVLPPLPFDGPLPLATLPGAASILFVGPTLATAGTELPATSWFDPAMLAIWFGGAVVVLGAYAVHHHRYCRRLRAQGEAQGQIDGIRIIAADVEGPLAFGVVYRFIAVPRDFVRDYTPGEQALALAHECAHHARRDLVANWLSLVVLAAHWWNPVAWVAIRAFREDQEMAADARVLDDREPATLALYARVLAKASGVGALPACNLNARSNLKGRLLALRQRSRSSGTLSVGGAMLALSAGTALAATAIAPEQSASEQAVTIGVKPDGRGTFALILGSRAVAVSARLPSGVTLPVDFQGAGGCDLASTAKPFAMVIRGTGTMQTYTVMCASAPPAPVRATLAEGLRSLQTLRASVATQPASAAFPEAERAHALGAIDRSIGEVEAALAALN